MGRDPFEAARKAVAELPGISFHQNTGDNNEYICDRMDVAWDLNF